MYLIHCLKTSGYLLLARSSSRTIVEPWEVPSECLLFERVMGSTIWLASEIWNAMGRLHCFIFFIFSIDYMERRRACGTRLLGMMMKIMVCYGRAINRSRWFFKYNIDLWKILAHSKECFLFGHY
ncbi:uncharacterized protein LOC130739880 isoform X2 [Lotus japonicus]|uniref:uncharacterized protein LOC130710000 isoform X1 n=1 Tax=Lotus japonicus TaxID=34305 RepID=UPI00258CF7A2|nr:uncharacterized protein LOC130710000 isoform X1 [Lotus japonicus]XP_057434317.1 uncharacterized protein LOC130727006 isoform X2 [Lotus japonicus]XP_057448320.1 uncharacterized protein LOC130739880 isoform X2 [Lotus japonicus]